jgi:hypothetical protein
VEDLAVLLSTSTWSVFRCEGRVGWGSAVCGKGRTSSEFEFEFGFGFGFGFEAVWVKAYKIKGRSAQNGQGEDKKHKTKKK